MAVKTAAPGGKPACAGWKIPKRKADRSAFLFAIKKNDRLIF
jgi:hypothetical protein